MLVAALARFFNAKTAIAGLLLFQEQAPPFDLLHMWSQMGWPARTIAIVLLLMSAWSIGVMIDRWLAFRAARNHSRQFAPAVGGALREGKLNEAIQVAERNKKSHLAKVVSSGLQEYQLHEASPATPEEKIEASRRALERAEAIVHAELERGLSGLATIGSTAPFVGLLGTVIALSMLLQKSRCTGPPD